MSGVLQNVDRYEAVFDDEGLVADAGLLAAGTLMDRFGFEYVWWIGRCGWAAGWVARIRVVRYARW